MKLPRHPLVLAVKPIIEALGAQLVPLEAREPGDLPLKWEGAEVAVVRMAPLHGALDRLIEGVEREFGTRLAEMSIVQQLGGTFERDWKPQGLCVTMSVAANRLHRGE